ncbi:MULTISPECIES: Rho-binding antiterminator [unclassified Pseudoalteromonas]|jgi:transcriptional antiterminator Rof (Rho-off)|uniref:Rho-binding antiterminator n=1 Tax=unclassified Pseudoalteromonas TaxID=194690 RepID=UPI00110866B2|nr:MULTISPECIES: Rho-binding antiterminator [unclassified Pseudoalteromonas]MCF2899703.1 Rho-binding antiterminator [Pseudoalteromonas sp. OFAV1]MCO7248888.1 Rho-binding antiterminator [Pseudoalteromonas sp. Ps84H-4]TMO46022.1 Rho-binding antiterminator [Pseudoalteromonas sp. S4389]
MTYQPIDCGDYDKYELWCMHKSLLSITLVSGEQVEGRAETLKIFNSDGEHLILATKKGEHAVRLDLIKKVIAL